MKDLGEIELQKLKDVINGITGDEFPAQHAHFIWSTYNHINDAHESTPCLCGSAAHIWERYIKSHREYLKGKELIVKSVEEKPYKRNFEEQPFSIDDFLLYVQWKEDEDGTVDSEGDRLSGLPQEKIDEYYSNKDNKLKEKYESLTSDEIIDILMYLGLIENNK